MGEGKDIIGGPASPRASIKPGVISKVLNVENDDEHLYAMGYEQHMKRGFTYWSMISFCLTGLGLLPALGGLHKADVNVPVVVNVFAETRCRHALVQPRVSWVDVYDLGLACC